MEIQETHPQREFSEWSEINEDLKNDILAWLPLECCCRLRGVSKEWNALFLSSNFITNRWTNAPPNKKPLLILCPEDSERLLQCLTYCFFTETWNKCISFSFLQEEAEAGRARNRVRYHGSAAGLFLVSILAPSGGSTLHVCNPLTRMSLQLPSMAMIERVDNMGIVQGMVGDGEVDGQETYKVVVIGSSPGISEDIVEIYDSSEGSWTMAERLSDVYVEWMEVDTDMVFCDGFFYCKAFSFSYVPHLQSIEGILGFSMTDRTSIFVRLPLGIGWHQVVTCGSRVLLAGGITLEAQLIIIWEFHKAGSNPFSWVEIARMPPLMFEKIERFQLFQCVGLEDCVGLIAYEGGRCGETKVAIYNVNKKSWYWLPSCPWTMATKSMTFEPGPIGWSANPFSLSTFSLLAFKQRSLCIKL